MTTKKSLVSLSSKVWSWIGFSCLTLGLLTLYLVAQHDHGLEPFLKGLSFLQHFSIHYVVGIFFGLLILIGYRLLRASSLNVPLILSASILWSHFPDIRFIWRRLPHQTWEILFFFHTVVDEQYWLFLPIVLIDVLLIVIYIIKIHHGRLTPP